MTNAHKKQIKQTNKLKLKCLKRCRLFQITTRSGTFPTSIISFMPYISLFACKCTYVLFYYLSHRLLHHSWADTGIRKSWSHQCRCLHSDMDWTDNHQYLWEQTEKERLWNSETHLVLLFFTFSLKLRKYSRKRPESCDSVLIIFLFSN